jgi:hypothetical protein
MHTLSRLASLTLSIVLLAPACASDADQPSSRIRLEAAGGDCDDPQQVCLEMHPPQCFDVCPGDDPGDDGDDCVSSDDSDLVTCGDDTCVIGTDDDGQETVVCPGSDCTVSYDVETGEETISCPPNPGDDDGGGSEPGNPGTGG